MLQLILYFLVVVFVTAVITDDFLDRRVVLYQENVEPNDSVVSSGLSRRYPLGS